MAGKGDLLSGMCKPCPVAVQINKVTVSWTVVGT